MKKAIFAALLTIALALPASAFETKCQTCPFFHSDALGADIAYRIFLPPGYDKDTDRRYPVVYLLHGYNFVRNNPEKEVPREGVNHWMDQERIPEIGTCLMTVSTTAALDKCITAGGIESPNDIVSSLLAEYPGVKLPLPPMIIVTPDGRNSFYMDRLDGKPLFPPEDGPDYVNGLFKGATGQFETYITRDLVAFIDKTYRTMPDRAHRGIGGFSMGAVGSMLLALKHQDLFSSVTALSATFSLEERFNNPFDFSYVKETIPESLSVMVPLNASGAPSKKYDINYVRKNDPGSVAKNLDKINLAVYFDAGDNDFFSGKNSFETFKKFDKILRDKGLTPAPAVHVIKGDDGNGKGLHTSRYWRSRVAVILEFHAKAFGME